MNKMKATFLATLMLSSISISGFSDINVLAKEKEKPVIADKSVISAYENKSEKMIESLININDKLKMIDTKVYLVSYDLVEKNKKHIVKKDESLFDIANRYGLNETKLAVENKLTPEKELNEDGQMQFDLKENQEINLGDIKSRETKEIILNKKEKIKDEVEKQNLDNYKIESEMSYKEYTDFKNATMSSEIKEKIETQKNKTNLDNNSIKELEEKQRQLEKKLEEVREKERKELIAKGLSEKEALEKQLANEQSSTTAGIKEAGQVSGSLADKYQKSLNYAESLLGVPYVFGGTSEFGIDCSGYIYKAYNAGGIPVPRTTAEGYYNMSDKISNPSVGDLVFFSNTYRAGISHIGIYIGGGKMINAGGDYVHIADITKGYWAEHFTGFGRLSQLNK